MKPIFSLASVLFLFLASSFTAPQSLEQDDITGLWWNAEKTAKIRIYKAKNGKYFGKIDWLKEPNDANGNPKKDPENPNKEKRDRDRLGMLVVIALEWDSKEKLWDDGFIYDPNNGKTYEGYVKMNENDKDKLFLRGYVMGMTWLGRTSEWERVK